MEEADRRSQDKSWLMTDLCFAVTRCGTSALSNCDAVLTGLKIDLRFLVSQEEVHLASRRLRICHEQVLHIRHEAPGKTEVRKVFILRDAAWRGSPFL